MTTWNKKWNRLDSDVKRNIARAAGFSESESALQAWAEFNKWYAEGLSHCANASCVRPRYHRGDCSPYPVDAMNADRVPQ